MSFEDRSTNTVYFAECLSDRYPDVFDVATSFLRENKIKVKLIKGTKNIWCRDYMPIQVGDHFVKFRYADSNFKHRKKPSPKCYKEFSPITSKILLDGGNIMRYEEEAFVTWIVMKDNPGLKLSTLENLLEAKVTLIPIEPYDDLGHSDGILNFDHHGSVIVNDYLKMKAKYWHTYHENLMKALKGRCIRYLPNMFEKTPKMTEKQFRKQFPFADDFGPGFGYYMNFLRVKDSILLPKFNIPEDEGVLKKMKELFPLCKIKQIDCSKLSMEGGLIHCVSWNIIK